jgi:hypothetical protein
VRRFGFGRPLVAGVRSVSVGRRRSELAWLLLTLLETSGVEGSLVSCTHHQTSCAPPSISYVAPVSAVLDMM